jgi:hypothetical protein
MTMPTEYVDWTPVTTEGCNCYDYYTTCCPYWNYTIYEESKVDKAWKIVTELIEFGVIDEDELTIKKFIGIVNKVAALV